MTDSSTTRTPILLPAGEAKTIEDLDRQHGIEEKEEPPVGILLLAGLIVIGSMAAFVAGILYRLWLPDFLQ